MPYLPYIDAITASTQILADRMSDIGGRPAYVIPNYLPLRWFRKASYMQKTEDGFCRRTRQHPDTLNLMMVGTPTHDEDWRVINDLILDLLNDYANLRVIFAGHKPEYAANHERVSHLPPRQYAAYPSMLFEADIVCAGIDPDDPFNHAKSAVKALESWAAKRKLEDGSTGGAAIIATDSVVYRDVVEDERNGLLVPHTHEGWNQAIRKLIEDETLRHSLQRRGYSDVAKYSLSKHYRKWVSAYKRIRRNI
jgi:glycosyltransferase involved in cell wall biosynthesis